MVGVFVFVFYWVVVEFGEGYGCDLIVELVCFEVFLEGGEVV